MFELVLSAKKTVFPLELPYKMVFKAMMTIRYAILTHVADASEIMTASEVELDESCFGGKRRGNRGRKAARKVSVFGFLTRKGRTFVEVVPNVTAVIRVGLKVVKALYIRTDTGVTIVYCDWITTKNFGAARTRKST